ncbi:MAG TPA: zf-HC2 domain-containing protein [Syntrophomonadaceae bacterium]|nr:zf-HC2 domain-containing protein [Syntrophomonadaceae bacterium]
MICPDSVKWNIYLDHEIDDLDQAQYAAHLLECAACRRMVSGLQEQNELISLAVRETHVPVNLENMVRMRLAGSARRQHRTKVGASLSFLTLAIILGALNWWYLLPGIQSAINFLGGQTLALKLAFSLVRFLVTVGEGALRGSPVLPAFTLLTITSLWIGLHIKKGGYVNA